MTRIILRALNGPILILLMAIGVALQTSLFYSYPLMYLQPDLVLIVVIWCAIKRDFVEGGIITLILANIAEVHSTAPQGMYLSCYMLVYLAIRFSSRYVLIEKLTTLIGLTLVSSILWKLSGLGVLHLLGISQNQWRHTLILLLPGAAVEGAIAVWVYRWLEKYDWITFKDAKRRQALDDESQLDEEGL